MNPSNWTSLTKRGIVFHRGDPDAWDGGMVECPVVWFDERRQQYGMVYTGYALKPGHTYLDFGYASVTRPQIGLAWSSDLLQWTRDAHSPIFGASDEQDSVDSHGASGPFMLPPSLSGRAEYTLFYFGVTGEGYEGGLKSLNSATSRDLYTWARNGLNPIIAPTKDERPNRWRSTAIWHPNVIRGGDKFYCFFNASGELDGYHEEFIGYATSTDLVSWSVHDDHCPIVTGSRLGGHWDSSGRAGDPSVFKVGDTWWMAFYSWDNIHTQDGLMFTTDGEFPLGWKPYKNNPVLKLGAPGSFDSLHAGKPFVFRTESTHYHFYTAVDENGKREIAVATAMI